MNRLRERTTATLLIAIFMISIIAIPIAIAKNPQGRGTQKLRPTDGTVKGEYIWVWEYMWSTPHPEIESGTWVTIGWGWGSTTRDTLEEILETQELVFVIDGCELVDPKQYYNIEFKQTYWSLSFKYAHPPFCLGEHTWSVSGISGTWKPTISGSFTVVERE